MPPKSAQLIDALNGNLTAEYRSAGFAVAQVSYAFHTHSETQVNVPGLGALPYNVATVCNRTWACSLRPVGPDIHANDFGYRTIAVPSTRCWLPTASSTP